MAYSGWGLIAVDILESVLERLGVTENTMITVKREVGGKIRVTSCFEKRPR